MTRNDGMPCRRCGGSEWYSSGKCVQCKREQDRRYRENNPDKISERKRAYVLNNPEAERLRKRKWEEINRDRVREAERRRVAADPERYRENYRRYSERHPDRRRESRRRWEQANPEKVNAKNQRRRERMREVGGKYSAAEFKSLCDRYDNRCLACGRQDVKLTADHVIPLAQGGSNDISNVQPLCLSCNSIKGERVVDYRFKSATAAVSK